MKESLCEFGRLMAWCEKANDLTLRWKQEVILAVAAIGVGCLFQTPLIGLHAAMPLKVSINSPRFHLTHLRIWQLLLPRSA
jgi:hypothetical protein